MHLKLHPVTGPVIRIFKGLDISGPKKIRKKF